MSAPPFRYRFSIPARVISSGVAALVSSHSHICFGDGYSVVVVMRGPERCPLTSLLVKKIGIVAQKSEIFLNGPIDGRKLVLSLFYCLNLEGKYNPRPKKFPPRQKSVAEHLNH
jgi:hypothetical protein